VKLAQQILPLHTLPTESLSSEAISFEKIAYEIESKGFCIQSDIFPKSLLEALCCYQNATENKFIDAGIGRGIDYSKNTIIRTDEISWITDNNLVGKQWLQWTSNLQIYLNRRLLLGLFSFESHFAHYSKNDFYKRHYDAFRGDMNRVLSIILYLNSDWTAEDGGELVLYHDDIDQVGTKIAPTYGTLVVFLSDEFPHEVLPTRNDRYSIAGWFRVNTSVSNKVDPAK
jgi:SM-20-related protein